MSRALDLAARALGLTSPNPVVGAVLVRDGEVVGEGWHARAGEPHAEVVALAAAGDRARGATLYVTLEPCNHLGRTPPCAAAVLEAGVASVVCAVGDPNPHVAGGGLAWLRERGVEVLTGVLEDEARLLNRFFFKWVSARKPFVTCKMAMTLDGRSATRTGHSQWITSDMARARVHEERALHDAILVGAGTVRADDPRLTVRMKDVVHAGMGGAREAGVGRSGAAGAGGAHRWYRVPPEGVRRPLRVVVGEVPASARVLDASEAPTLVCVGRGRPVEAVRARGAEVVELEQGDVGEVLARLGERGVLSVFVEGGPRLHGALLRAGLVDRVLAFVAPVGVGGREAVPAVRWAELEEGTCEGRTPRLVLQDPIVEPFGPDLMLDGAPRERD